MEAPTKELTEAVWSEVTEIYLAAGGSEGHEERHKEDHKDCELCTFFDGMEKNAHLTKYLHDVIGSFGPIAMLAGNHLGHHLCQIFMYGCRTGHRMGMVEAQSILLSGSSIPAIKKVGRIRMLRAKLKGWIVNWL